MFKEYFPSAVFVDHSGYPFEFKGNGNFRIDLLSNAGAHFNRLREEHKEVEELVKIHRPDIVISDHRYGFHSDDLPSVFITHQVNLPTKWFEAGVNRNHQKRMSKFDHIWVMDYADNRLAGDLSKDNGEVVLEFIGPYSRFAFYDALPSKTVETTLIASGPSVYAQQLVDHVMKGQRIEKVVCADQIELLDESKRVRGGWRLKDEVIMRSERIISRSGYSTIMDVEFLKLEASFYPTKGQTEQEYLHKLHA